MGGPFDDVTMRNKHPYITKARFDAMCGKPMRPLSDIADAAIYGMDFAQRRGRTASINLANYGPYWFFDESAPVPDYLITITQGNPMQEQTTPTKQFVTHDVPGFPDGTQLHLSGGAMGSALTFSAYRKTEGGIEVRASFYLSPENFAAHVRVKAVKPPKVEKK